MSIKEQYIVTISPPTPNGDLHLGHLSGPFLAGDIFKKVQLMKGNTALLLCYSDDHQSYLARKALQTNTDLETLAKTNKQLIEQTMAMADLSIDWFMQSFENPIFKQCITDYYDLFQQLGMLDRESLSVPYCSHCDVYGYEGFGRGICNHCNASSDASQCENCAQVPDINKMGEISCILCERSMELKQQNREVVLLDRAFDKLVTHYKNTVPSSKLGVYLNGIFSQPELVWPIDRPNEIGINISDSKRIHTWFSGLAGYKATLIEYLTSRNELDQLSALWGNKKTHFAHFFGFDCSFSHAVVYPAQLLNEANFSSSVHHYTNAFLQLENGDFSTSRGHAIWIRDCVKEDGGADAIRWYLALNAPINEPTNFSQSSYHRWRDNVFTGFWSLLENLYTPTKSESISPNVWASAERIRKDWQRVTDVRDFRIDNIANISESLRLMVLDALEKNDRAGARLLGMLFIATNAPICTSRVDRFVASSGLDLASVSNWLNGNLSCRYLYNQYELLCQQTFTHVVETV